MEMKMCALLSFYILAVCFMGYCVSGAHIEFKEDFKEMGNVKRDMGAHLETSNPIGETENTERELARQHQQKKRVNHATVIDAASLTKDVLQTLLDALGSIERKIAIGIANETPYEWRALNTYFRSGTSDDLLPPFVKKDQAPLYTARKTNGPVATGCVAVIAYYMPAVQMTVGVMFSVPFDQNFYRNWWNARVYPGEVRASQRMYEDMYYGNPFRGDNGWHKKDIGHGFHMDGSMTSPGKSVMELHITSN
ncbi:DELTA-stichotoxin-She4a-like [Stylophora pistillata]|uniref:Cytolysin-3 n=1 Tax=Stylophora pistillata TaxID=50429 RepID=A0A2B4R4R1_STYPI|nr:DELTA-stichotoxin-She4a-like [Stylophora pistillata]PFX11793.1 Cytolysin-3 [Stylophora pistillata]